MTRGNTSDVRRVELFFSREEYSSDTPVSPCLLGLEWVLLGLLGQPYPDLNRGIEGRVPVRLR